jgi:hypothetical protein
MPSPDYIPGPDSAFDAFFAQFNAWVQANGATHGLLAAAMAELNDLHGDWTAFYPAHLAAQTAAETARVTKDNHRAACETVIRALARTIQNHPNTTNPERSAAGLTIRDPGRTPAAVPTSRPVAQVDTSQRLRHTIHFKDELTPNSKKKPDGVLGVEIWCALGPNPPADAGACVFVALDTSSPHVIRV